MNVRLCPILRRVTRAPDACAYFATFCSASPMAKYTAASVSWGYRPVPSASTVTGNGAFLAWAARAASSP